MAEPSEYELAKWRDLQRTVSRPKSRVQQSSEQVAVRVSELGKRTARQLEKHPRSHAAVTRGQEVVAKGAHLVSAGARGAADALPDWSGTAFQSVRQSVARAARAGLSSKRVVALHKKHGHDVATLHDLRRLDLEQIDAVRGRAASWYYPLAAAISGAGAGLAISGGELVTAASAGAAAAPSTGAIAGAIAADAAVVLALVSRCVGQVSLHYGYDPDEPAEKLFVMSVVNAGTATSATAKAAAMADVSRLTQALVRGKTWETLNKSVVTKVSKQFAAAFGTRLTKKGLGKIVPAVGIVIGGAFNWTTLDATVDAAELAYRRRFLLEKYPQLRDEQAPAPEVESDVADDGDQTISVLDELAESGGPDLR